MVAGTRVRKRVRERSTEWTEIRDSDRDNGIDSRWGGCGCGGG